MQKNNTENFYNTKSVFVALVGKPNVGKSSLLNTLVRDKLAIVTQKPQTTRTRIKGILTENETQFVFFDTPGIHIPRSKLGEHMERAVKESIADVDVIVMIFEPYRDLNEAELELIDEIKKRKLPAIAVINKIDTLKQKEDLLERIQALKNFDVFSDFFGVSALKNEGVKELLSGIEVYSIEGPHFFPSDSLTDIPEKTIVEEIVREKALLFLQDEIPHGIAVVVEAFKERRDKNLIDIDVTVYCEKKSHKGMIIGKNGAMLKKIATAARIDIEDFLQTKINMQCWVKIKEDWRNSEFLLNDFGYQKRK
jgi:GTP-binding protein Era